MFRKEFFDGLHILPNFLDNLSYEAIVQEMVAREDGEIRLIVERTTKVYRNPLNSLHIGEDTKLLDEKGNAISVEDLQTGVNVKVTLKDAFTEETPFYYPTSAYSTKERSR